MLKLKKYIFFVFNGFRLVYVIGVLCDEKNLAVTHLTAAFIPIQ